MSWSRKKNHAMVQQGLIDFNVQRFINRLRQIDAEYFGPKIPGQGLNVY